MVFGFSKEDLVLLASFFFFFLRLATAVGATRLFVPRPALCFHVLLYVFMSCFVFFCLFRIFMSCFLFF